MIDKCHWCTELAVLEPIDTGELLCGECRYTTNLMAVLSALPRQ